jgi:RHS repeat-associated protein
VYTRTGTYHSPAFLEPKTLENNTRYPKVRLVYSAFGVILEGRKSVPASGEYRYDFNGKETDTEVDWQDYGFRIYNPKLGKFISMDPISTEYPELTAYQFASNRPIDGVDLDGLEYTSAVTWARNNIAYKGIMWENPCAPANPEPGCKKQQNFNYYRNYDKTKITSDMTLYCGESIALAAMNANPKVAAYFSKYVGNKAVNTNNFNEFAKTTGPYHKRIVDPLKTKQGDILYFNKDLGGNTHVCIASGDAQKVSNTEMKVKCLSTNSVNNAFGEVVYTMKLFSVGDVVTYEGEDYTIKAPGWYIVRKETLDQDGNIKDEYEMPLEYWGGALRINEAAINAGSSSQNLQPSSDQNVQSPAQTPAPNPVPEGDVLCPDSSGG